MFRAVSKPAGLSAVTPPGELQIKLANQIPDLLPLGKGTALCLSGWYQPATAPVRSVCCVINESVFPVQTQAVPRDELPNELLTESAGPHCYGFWTILPLTEQTAPPGSTLEIRFRAALDSGATVEQVIARTRVQAQREFSLRLRGVACPPGAPSFATEPAAKVAICMATYNPDPVLFRRQIESIRAQTHANWRCLISDDGSSEPALQQMQEILGADDRFVFYPFAERLGFYHNFERVLTLAPAEAEFIALADQDDYWYPHKLATLLAHFDEQTRLVYSDLRLATPEGTVLADTYWTLRRNNCTELGPLLLMNTVPGASAMLRRALLAELLPFPNAPGQLFHDHWLGVLALAGGPVRYVDEPLYDYTQHPKNVIGYAEKARLPWLEMLRRYCSQVLTQSGRRDARQVYFVHVLRIAVLARVAALRAGGRLTRRNQRVLERAATLDHSWRSLGWLLLQGLRDWRQVGLTNGTEYFLLSAALWRQTTCLKSWWQRLRN